MSAGFTRYAFPNRRNATSTGIGRIVANPSCSPVERQLLCTDIRVASTALSRLRLRLPLLGQLRSLANVCFQSGRVTRLTLALWGSYPYMNKRLMGMLLEGEASTRSAPDALRNPNFLAFIASSAGPASAAAVRALGAWSRPRTRAAQAPPNARRGQKNAGSPSLRAYSRCLKHPSGRRTWSP